VGHKWGTRETNGIQAGHEWSTGGAQVWQMDGETEAPLNL